ncbi:MAG: hypothetical protein IJP03_02755 [Christensenellaceae bacterium]|nr:hypothetical protein [Christensenellaceae bacterium]
MFHRSQPVGEHAALQPSYAAVLQKQLRIMRAIAILCGAGMLVLTLFLIGFAPRLAAALETAQTAAGELSAVTDTLSDPKLSKAISDFSELLSENQTVFEDAGQDLSKLDIQGLNESIKDLKTVLSPIAQLLESREP